MRKLKLGVLGLVSVFVLSLGLDTSIQTKDSTPKVENGIKLFSEHGVHV
jgi:hypothetical protein